MLVSLFPFAAFADGTAVTTQTFYVDTNAGSNGTGTEESPYNDLQYAVTQAGQNPTTVVLKSNIELNSSVNLTTGQNIIIDGNGHSISYSFDGSSGVKVAFTGSASGQVEGIPGGVTLTVNNVKFINTDTSAKVAGAGKGYAALIGGNSVGTAVALNQCSFENLYCGVYVNQFTSTENAANAPKLTITGSTYTNTTYGYSIDETTTNTLVGASKIVFEKNDGVSTVKETWPDYVFLTEGNITKVVGKDLLKAINQATSGETISLSSDMSVANVITLPAGVTLDGNGHTLTYTGGSSDSLTNGAFITATNDDVTIKNITIDANNIKHGVQFYCCDGGTLENATVNGGAYTAVMVNGATDVTIADSDLNPAEGAYANIEYGMGGDVTTIPSMTMKNVSTTGDSPAVWVDDATVAAMKTTMGAGTTDEQIQEKLLKQVTYTSNNGGSLELSVEYKTGITTPVYVESTYQPPYTGKYSYAINVANMDNGSVSVDKYATEGEKVTLTVTPDKAYKLDELTVTANGKDVELTNNGDGTYTFTMPSSNVKVGASFVEDKDYVEPDNSITISMTVGSNDFVINDTIVTIPDAAPYIANDRTYVPFRALGEALGAKVVWDNDARTVTYTLGDTEIVMTIGDTTYTINGVEKSMDVAPEITGDRTYVPVRFVAEGLGFKVTPLYADNGTTASVVFEK